MTFISHLVFQAKMICNKTPNRIESNKEEIEQTFEDSPHECTSLTTHIDIKISKLQQSLKSIDLYNEQASELIKTIKNEEERVLSELLEMELHSIEHVEDQIKRCIKFIKHQKKRMELEIDLMKSHEKPVEEVVFDETLLYMYDDEKYYTDKIKPMTKLEGHVSCEIERMEHYCTHLQREVRYLQRRSPINYSGENHSIEPKTNNSEETSEKLHTELVRRKTRLTELLNEIEKRQKKLEEYRDQRQKYYNKLWIVRNKIRQENERVISEKLHRTKAIERRQQQQRVLADICILHKKCEEKLLEYRDKIRIGEVQTEENIMRRIIFPLTACYREIRTHIRHLPLEETRLNVCYEKTVKFDSITIQDDKVNEMIPIFELPKYDVFISFTNQTDSTARLLKDALPQCFSTHVKGEFSSPSIKIYLDNTSTAAVALINRTYELNEICQADMIHIFKRQFPLVLVISEKDFKPSTCWLSIVYHAPTTQQVFLNSPDFKGNLRNALTDAQWNLSPDLNALTNAQWNLSSDLNAPKIIRYTRIVTKDRFLGNVHEWTVAYSNPAQVSQNYRQLINDPLRIPTDTKLQDIYYNYICIYFENLHAMELFKEGADKNDIRNFIRGYTKSGQFSSTLNSQLATNVLYYFGSALDETVDYRLVKCLIDFVALLIYREELQTYSFIGTVYRGALLTEADLSKYIVGSRIMNTSFLSASKDKKVADFFSGESQKNFSVVCTYEVRNTNNRRTALDISPLSQFPDEGEVLILPFSAFYVKSVKQPLDNLQPIEMTLIEDDLDALENTH